MRLVVQVLRISILFLNVYDTYKTLKPPALSKRNVGQLSTRALNRRKRDMKGCLSVWIVWCCLAAYEKVLDNVLSIVVPFHDEVKSFFMFFLLVTRARGAEPIFLHVIRPLIKPYTETVDAVLEMLFMFADIFFFLAGTPIRLVMSYWHNQSSDTDHTLEEFDSVDISTPVHELAALEPANPPRRPPGASRHPRIATDSVLDRRRRGAKPRQASGGHPDAPNPVRRSSESSAETQNAGTSGTDYAGSTRTGHVVGPHSRRPFQQRRNNGSLSAPAPSAPEIWYPPPTAYIEEQSTLEISSKEHQAYASPPPSQGQQAVEEWRLYPPFPAAYPPTPLPVTTNLPRASDSSANAERPPRFLSFPSIPEGQEDHNTSLPPPYDSLREGSNDTSTLHGSQNGTPPSFTPNPDDTEANDGDAEEDAEDDEFDLTLGTPLRVADLRRRGKSHRASSVSSAQSTALTTIIDESPTRAHTSFESTESDSDSLTGHATDLPEDSRKANVNAGKAPARQQPATWSAATRRAGAQAGPSSQNQNTIVVFSESTDSEGSNGGTKRKDPVAPSRAPAPGRNPGAAPERGMRRTRGKSKTAPGAGPARTSARLASARFAAGEAVSVSRTSSQDSVTAVHGRATLPRNGRTRQ